MAATESPRDMIGPVAVGDSAMVQVYIFRHVDGDAVREAQFSSLDEAQEFADLVQAVMDVLGVDYTFYGDMGTMH